MKKTIITIIMAWVGFMAFIYAGTIGVTNNLNVNGNITGNFYSAEMWYYNHTPTQLNFAVDGVYYNLNFDESDTYGFTFNDAEDALIVNYSGHYKACYMASGDGQNNHVYYTTIKINNVNQDPCESHKKMTAGGDIVSMNGCCILNLSVGDKLNIGTADVGGTGTGNYYSSNLNLVWVRN